MTVKELRKILTNFHPTSTIHFIRRGKKCNALVDIHGIYEMDGKVKLLAELCDMEADKP
jgi:hypothetical protein